MPYCTNIPWTRIGAALAVLIPLASGILWAGENVVLKDDFQQYQTQHGLEQRLFMLKYDDDCRWREFKELQILPNPTPAEKSRMADLQRERADIRSKIESLRGN